jgi:hypothetical protein
MTDLSIKNFTLRPIDCPNVGVKVYDSTFHKDSGKVTVRCRYFSLDENASLSEQDLITMNAYDFIKSFEYCVNSHLITNWRFCQWKPLENILQAQENNNE